MRNIVIIEIILLLFSCTEKKTIEGDKYYTKGEYLKALESYNKFLTIYPRNIKTLYNRALTYKKLEKIEKAKKDLIRLLELKPNHLQSRIALGEIEFELAHYKKSLYQFNKAVKSHNDKSKVYAYRAKANQKLGEIKKALLDYGIAIRINPSNGMAYLYRGTLYVSQKKNLLACNDFRKAKNLGIEEAEQAEKKYCQ